MLEWLALAKPDVLCLQETKLPDTAFPHAEFEAVGYATASRGSGQWNGVAIAASVGLADVHCGFEAEPGFPDPEARSISATCAGIRVWSIYAPNGRSVDSAHFTYKLAWLEALRGVIAADAAAQPMAVCGDFNIAPSDEDVWDPADFVGSTHVTPSERAAVASLLDLGLVDVQPRALKGRPFTYWDYRAGNFHRGLGMRIDLTLLSSALAAQVTDAYIDRETRKGTLPSDHAAVVVDLSK